MAIPFIIGAAAIVPPTDDPEKIDRTKEINSEAQRIAMQSEKHLNSTRTATNNTLQKLGKKKIFVMADSIKKFAENFSRIKNVRLTDSNGLEELRDFNPDDPEFLDMKKKSLDFSDVVTSVPSGVVSGIATAAGVYSAVGAFGAASTGTAISALSCAAITNATLAWLSGGSLAVGGFVIAGGTLVLGGLIAPPAPIITSLVLGSKADKALNEAKENREKARKYEQDVKNLCAAMEAISDRAKQIMALLDELNNKFRPSVNEMTSIIDKHGVDWQNYSQDEKKAIGIAVQLAQTLKTLVDTPLLTESGKLCEKENQKVIADVQKTLQTLN